MNFQNSNQTPATIVDVREPYEFQMGHVEGAINIPVGSVIPRIEEFRKMPKPIALYCQSGNRSGMAVSLLYAYGIEEAYNAGSLEEAQALMAQTS